MFFSLYNAKMMGCTDAKLQAPLEIIKEVLPLGPNEWGDVAWHHFENYAACTLDSLKHKFNALANNKNLLTIPIVPPPCAEQNISFILSGRGWISLMKRTT